MATYKVIQDIEAEDKLLGPLTLRQFIYAGICILLLYITYLAASKGAPAVAIVFLPVAAISGFFAWPWGRDQPTEVWALAKIRFLFKARKRLWDQSGAKELVTVTAPKKIETVYTNGLSQNEVHSRLETLANTIDSRGWAIKNVNVNLYAQPAQMIAMPDSDRLIALNNIPQINEVADFDVRAADDILDETNNPQAQRMETLIAASTKAHRAQMVQQMQASTPPPVAAPAQQSASSQQPAPANYWFMQPPGLPQQPVMTVTPTVIAPLAAPQNQPTYAAQSSMQPQQPAGNSQADEAALMEALRARDAQEAQANAYGHLHTLQPLSATPPVTHPAAAQSAPSKVTPAPNAAILQLARNDDLNVATIAREAHKRAEPQDEVVISLH